MPVNIHMYIHTNTHTHMVILMYIHTNTHTWLYICTYKHTHTHDYTYVHTYKHAHMIVHVYYMCIHTNTHMIVHVYYMYMQTNTHTHTHFIDGTTWAAVLQCYCCHTAHNWIGLLHRGPHQSLRLRWLEQSTIPSKFPPLLHTRVSPLISIQHGETVGGYQTPSHQPTHTSMSWMT